MAVKIGLYTLLDIGFSGGSPIASVPQPDSFFSDDNISPSTGIFGRSKSNVNSALFARFDLRSSINSLHLPAKGDQILTCFMTVIAKDVNTNPLTMEIATLRPDGIWDTTNGVNDMPIKASYFDLARVRLLNSSQVEIVSTPNYVVTGPLRKYPMLKFILFYSRTLGQSMLNNSGSDFAPHFVELTIGKTGVPTGDLVVRVYESIDGLPVGDQLYSDSDPVDITTLSEVSIDVRFTLDSDEVLANPHRDGEQRVYMLAKVGGNLPDGLNYPHIFFNAKYTGGTYDFGSAICGIQPVRSGQNFGVGFQKGAYFTGFDMPHLNSHSAYVGGEIKDPSTGEHWKTPHSPRVNVPIPAFPVVDRIYIIGLGGQLIPMAQRWIDDPRYPYSTEFGKEPIGITLSTIPGTLAEEEREISFDPNQVFLVMSWEDSRIGKPSYDSSVSAAVALKSNVIAAVR